MSSIDKFIGRADLFDDVDWYTTREVPSLISVKGRWGIGKTRFLAEYGKKFDHVYVFSAVPGVGAKEQKLAFIAELHEQLGVLIEEDDRHDWGMLFWHLAKNLPSTGRVLLVFDEIAQMVQDDYLFLPKLKNAWDLKLSHIGGLVFMVCGSTPAWIENKILNSTGFLVGFLAICIYRSCTWKIVWLFGKRKEKKTCFPLKINV